MYWLTRPIVWLSRIHRCRGFGIQSSTDYWFVRYVINEHWPYYGYETTGRGDDRLTRKLGRLYFRLANWRQPRTISCDGYQDYFLAGCRRAVFGDSAELIHIVLDGDYCRRWSSIVNKVDEHTVLIIEGIHHDLAFWQEVIDNEKASITFDLYYCGIVLFSKKRYKTNYIINF